MIKVSKLAPVSPTSTQDGRHVHSLGVTFCPDDAQAHVIVGLITRAIFKSVIEAYNLVQIFLEYYSFSERCVGHLKLPTSGASQTIQSYNFIIFI